MKHLKRKLFTLLTVTCVLCAMSVPAFGAETIKDGGRAAKAQSVESNSALNNATPVSLNTSCSGSITDSNTANYYRFTLDSSGAVNLKGTMYMSRAYITIFDSDGEKVWGGYGFSWNETTKQIALNETINLTSGTYYICIEQDWSATGNYNFQLNYTSANESFQEGSGKNNDSMANADAINVNTAYKGQIAEKDEYDYYKFTLANSGKIDLQGTMYMQYAYITIFDSAGEKAWGRYEFYWNETTRQIALDEQIDLTSGTYYICIEQHYGATGNYNFQLNYVSANESFQEGSGKNNDSMANADAINVNTAYKGQIAEKDEYDYYKFTLANSGAINLRGTMYMKYAYITVFNSAGEKVWGRYEFSWNETTRQIALDEQIDLTSGTYYICIEQHYGATGNYNFRLNYASANESFKESGWGTNNDIPTASHISLNKRYYGQIADNDKKDFYRFSMPSAGKIEIKMTGYANLYLAVYDAAGNKLDGWSKSVDSSKGSWNGDWILTLKKGGTYYFCVERDYSSTGNYNFSISNFTSAISVRSSFKKVQGDGSFQLNASVNDESSKLTYSSSNSKVATVSESGWVYIEGPGKATITVRIDGTSIKKNVQLTVAPSKPYLYKVTSGKRSLKATWDRNTKATGYQLVAATDKKFKKNKKTATLKKNKTVVKTLKKLKRKKVYYVKVRAYKQVGKTKIYSSYSNHRKVRVK